MNPTPLLIILSLLLSFNLHGAENLTFVNPWIAEAPPGASVMAGYMEIHNPGKQSVDIIGISSMSFKSVEMHLSKESDGFAKMLPQKKLSIAAGSKIVLESGSYHLMLIKPIKWFKQGEQIKLNFTLSNNKTTAIDVRIKKNIIPSMKCAAGKCGSK